MECKKCGFYSLDGGPGGVMCCNHINAIKSYHMGYICERDGNGCPDECPKKVGIIKNNPNNIIENEKVETLIQQSLKCL